MKPKLEGRAALLATLTEAEWLRQVCEWATRAGWRAYHTHDSRRSVGGFPDLVLVKPGHPVIFAELKTINGRISPMQRVWLDDLSKTSGHALVCTWRPDMEAEVKQILFSEQVPTITMSSVPLGSAGQAKADNETLKERGNG